MKKVNTSPISGVQELLPKVQATFDSLKTNINNSYLKHGFLNIETPYIERTEILLAKAGNETEKQIYKITKTDEKESGQALRFDHTVPLARYIVEHENDLTFPFKVAQTGVDFRGERAQKGRFREFYQCDIDVIGRDSLPIAYDADVIITLLDTFKTFNLKTPVLSRISNRKILSGLLEALNITDKAKDVYSIIDHAEKVPPEKTQSDLEEIGLDSKNIETILNFINLKGNRSDIIEKLNHLGINNETFLNGIDELNQILLLLEAAGLENSIEADMKIVRGLDYYTGTVFEFILPEYKDIGSVCGGGRYENLASFFTEKSFPGVGGSIGLTRLFYVLNEKSLLKSENNLLDYAIIPVSASEFNESIKIAKKLREKNYTTTIVFTDKKLGDKISYATKIARNGVVIGEEEVKTGNLKVKNFKTSEEKEFYYD